MNTKLKTIGDRVGLIIDESMLEQLHIDKDTAIEVGIGVEMLIALSDQLTQQARTLLVAELIAVVERLSSDMDMLSFDLRMDGKTIVLRPVWKSPAAPTHVTAEQIADELKQLGRPMDTTLDIRFGDSELVVRPIRESREERVRAAAKRVADDHAKAFEKLAR